MSERSHFFLTCSRFVLMLSSSHNAFQKRQICDSRVGVPRARRSRAQRACRSDRATPGVERDPVAPRRWYNLIGFLSPLRSGRSRPHGARGLVERVGWPCPSGAGVQTASTSSSLTPSSTGKRSITQSSPASATSPVKRLVRPVIFTLIFCLVVS